MRTIGTVVGVAAALIAIAATNLVSYLLFHSIVELFSIVVATGIFAIAWHSRHYVTEHYLLLIGCAFLGVGLIDLLHTLAYEGMGVFPSRSADLPTQLWIAGRAIEAVAIAVAPLFISRRLRGPWALTASLAAALFLLITIFAGVFPACYVPGKGLTEFKVIAEYVISLLLALGAVGLYRKRDVFPPEISALLITAILTLVVSELAFTLYVDVYGLWNTIGHLLKLVAMVLIYRAVIATGIERPYDLLFRDLESRERRLRSANEELEAFSYSVSHDLQAPITRIQGFSDLMVLEYGDSLDATGRDYLQRIHEGAVRMNELIEDLLRLSRITRTPLAASAVDLVPLAKQIVTDVRSQEPEREVEIVLPADLWVRGDPGLLRIVLENLIRNAWKFTSKREQARIELGMEREEKTEVGIFVRDNGAGFEPARADRLFAPFQRLHSEKEFSGSGIGLATVQRIVNLHGGSVRASGSPNEGATFWFTLPQ
ncbi:MAG: MASE3 domain-containing protein [Thermoanaerobaculia bacterium]